MPGATTKKKEKPNKKDKEKTIRKKYSRIVFYY